MKKQAIPKLKPLPPPRPKRAANGSRKKPGAAPPEAAPVSAPAPPPASHSYEIKKERERERAAQTSRKGRDIGQLPPPEDAERRAKAWDSLKFFAETYFPERFPLEWSPDHLALIAEMEQIINVGGLEAFAMPRGSGKTTICEVAVLWATMTGRRKFVALIGASKAHADEMLESIKGELETNDLLAADFPEVCLPIWALEGINNRCKGQLHNGERTWIRWSGATVVLPTIAGSKASSAIICVRGITGRVRGMKFMRPDGENARPDLAFVDDPQTDQSAHSVGQCTKRLSVVTGAVLGLAGPGKKIAAFMPCTIIVKGDMADQVLDRKAHPEWHGRICQLVYAFPTDVDLWEEYAERRRQDQRAGGDGSAATEFYSKNRKAMDAGAKIAWPARKNPDELSALQHAMNLKIDHPSTYDAEYQNSPKSEISDDEQIMTAEDIAAKVNLVARGVVPLGCSKVTAFIDVQHSLLYWGACAWEPDFTGAVIDYGAWPDQKRSYFTLRDARFRLKDVTKANSAQAAVLAGLWQLVEELMTREWINEDGTAHRVERLLIDWGDKNIAKEVAEVCRKSKYAANLLPAGGRSFGPADTPLDQYTKKPGESVGYHFLVQTNRTYAVRQLVVDTNFWKSFVHERLATPQGERGSLALFGRKGTDHRMLSEHLVSEFRKRLTHEKTRRKVDMWKLKPEKPDNHLLDVVVGCAVAAATQGCLLADSVIKSKPQKPGRAKRSRVTYLD